MPTMHCAAFKEATLQCQCHTQDFVIVQTAHMHVVGHACEHDALVAKIHSIAANLSCTIQFLRCSLFSTGCNFAAAGSCVTRTSPKFPEGGYLQTNKVGMSKGCGQRDFSCKFSGSPNPLRQTPLGCRKSESVCHVHINRASVDRAGVSRQTGLNLRGRPKQF